MIFTVPTGPILAKKRPKFISVILDGRLDCHQMRSILLAHNEQIRCLASASFPKQAHHLIPRETSALFSLPSCPSVSPHDRNGCLAMPQSRYRPARAETEDPSTKRC